MYISDELNLISSTLIPVLNRQRHTCGFDVVKEYRSITPLAQIIHSTRLIKSHLEIQTMKSAVAASIDGHIDVMRRCAPDVNALCTRSTVLPAEFICSCNPPFVGSGFVCSGMSMLLFVS